MTSKFLDNTGKRILHLLQANARISFSEIGRQIGMSTPAVIERVQKMEDAGIIAGYTVHIDPKALGYTVHAFIRLKTKPHWYPKIRELAQTLPPIMACHHVTGTDAFIMEARFMSVEDLEPFLEHFKDIGETSTSIVMSSYVDNHSPPIPD